MHGVEYWITIAPNLVRQQAGDVGHLDTAFLLADGIAHGINLRWTPVLQSAVFWSRC